MCKIIFKRVSLESMVQLNTRIKATKICIKRREIKDLIQDLKNQLEELLINERNAKGLISTKICIIMYLKENEISILIRP